MCIRDRAKVWQEEVYVLDRTIDVNITRLRKKIGEYGKCIVTRLGYHRFQEFFIPLQLVGEIAHSNRITLSSPYSPALGEDVYKRQVYLNVASVGKSRVFPQTISLAAPCSQNNSRPYMAS